LVDGNYQKRGIAKTMTKAFLNEASKRNLEVYWECWKHNNASYKAAITCGLKKISDYPVLFVELI
jgi:RimJ/RimL family protein N-acetyltransferase